MTETLVPTGTLVDALAVAIESAAAYDPNTHAAPVCILWTDEKGEWTPLLSRLRAEWPHVLTLGDYAPDARTGPAIWIKTALLRHVPEAEWPEDAIPIVYLPGVSRSMLRNAGSLPRELQPLAELQHRGVLFSQVNGKDWTILAFLASSEGGLGLDVARDAVTTDAMSRALTKLADVPVERLAGGRLEAEDFNALLAPDPIRDLLRWLDDPERFQEAQGPQHWAAFRDVCRERFGLDPEKAGPLAAVQRLGKGEGTWSDVWLRFTEAPHRYPKLPERLGQAKPSGTTGDLFGGVSEAWPQDNEQEEAELRAALSPLADATQAQATERIRQLEARHGKRRKWVWADIEKAPLARALKPLVALADAVGQPGGGSTVEACATAYTEHGWKADDAFVHALSAVKEKDDLQAVQAAALALYRPWLEQQATTFASVLGSGLPPQPDAAAIKPQGGCVWLFVDALRYDAGMRLKQMLEQAGTNVNLEKRWVAFPSLTPTSKPALSPIADQVSRESAMHDFAPESEAGPLTTHRFRALLKEGGFQVLASDEIGDPSGAAWAEIGLIDKRGHELGWKLACRLDHRSQVKLKTSLSSAKIAGFKGSRRPEIGSKGQHQTS